MGIEKFTTTRGARRATRDVVGGARDLAKMKVAARRAARRSSRRAARLGEDVAARRVTAWDVS